MGRQRGDRDWVDTEGCGGRDIRDPLSAARTIDVELETNTLDKPLDLHTRLHALANQLVAQGHNLRTIQAEIFKQLGAKVSLIGLEEMMRHARALRREAVIDHLHEAIGDTLERDLARWEAVLERIAQNADDARIMYDTEGKREWLKAELEALEAYMRGLDKKMHWLGLGKEDEPRSNVDYHVFLEQVAKLKALKEGT